MMMYPFKFEPILKHILWGGDGICEFKNIEPRESGVGESWEIAQVKKDISVVANGSLKGKTLTDLIVEFKADLLGKHVWEKYGEQFPLLIKFIDACDNLSIQVHPDDRLAAKRHGLFGKTEMWYVIAAKEGAGLYCGFSEPITPDQYVERVQNNTFMEVLRFHPVKSGDVFFLPAGRVHAIGKGIFIAEIQQTSDVTYRIYDYNRTDAQGNPRELHTDLAKDAIDYTVYPEYKTDYLPERNKEVPLVSCPYFTSNLLELDRPVTSDLTVRDSFAIYICMEGAALLTDAKGAITDLKQGDTVLVPANSGSVRLEPQPSAKLIECYIAG